MVMGHQKNKRRKISVHGVSVGKRVIADVHIRRESKKERDDESAGFIQLQEENQAFREENAACYNPMMVSLDDDSSYVTTASHFEIPPLEETTCYHTCASSIELSENVDPKEARKIDPHGKIHSCTAPCNLKNCLSEANVAKMDRAEIDRLIAYILYLLTKRRHHPLDVNSNCIEKEPFTFKKFLQIFRTARSSSPEKEKKAGLLEGLFSRSGMDRKSNNSVRKHGLPFGLLLNFLPSVIEAEGGDPCEAAKKLVHSDSGDATEDGFQSAFNAFVVAYYASKVSAQSDFRELLESIGNAKPDSTRIRRATNILIQNQSTVETQTLPIQPETGRYQQRGRGTNRERCTVVEMKRNARRAKLAAAGHKGEGKAESETSSSYMCDDLQDAPLPKAIVKPRSVSRHRKLCATPQLSSLSSSGFDDSTRISCELSLTTGGSMDGDTTGDSVLSSSISVPPVPCMTSTPIKSPPPPPPPPLPPPPSFLASPCTRPMSLGSLPVTKSTNTYAKKRATNTIHWEAVKSEVTVSHKTAFSCRDSSEANFNEEQRERLEKVFERVKKISQDMQGRKASSPVVQLLNEKRALSLGIVLAKFRPMTVPKLIEVLESLDDALDPDVLDTLLKHYPSDDELTLFNKYPSPEMLKDAELFCYLAARRPILKLRIELRVIVGFLKTDLPRQSDCVRALQQACKCVDNNKNINYLLCRCLQYGNFLNQSTFAARASGFTLNSLLDVLRAKGTSESTRLVDILAETAEPTLREVVQHITVLKKAKGNTVEDLEKSIGISQRKISDARKELECCGDEELVSRYSPTLKESIASYSSLVSTLKDIRKMEKDLQIFYCTTNMPLEKMLMILLDGICLFQEALTLAKEKEQRRLRQSKSRVAMNGKDLSNMPSKRRRNYLESPNVQDLVYILDTTDV